MRDHANWPTEIVRVIQWKQLAAEHDKLGALPWHLPRVAASTPQIELAESSAGRRFPPDYREFLSFADGWPGFYVSTDLFGTGEFVSGRALEIIKRPDISEFIVAEKWHPPDVLAIGASDVDIDVFLILSPESAKIPGSVVWWAGEEIDRYDSFKDFFEAMITYNAQIATKLTKQQ